LEKIINMFAKLALKNIKRSIKDYAIYFFTLVLGVAIFYVFNSLESQAIMLDVNERVKDMISLVNTIMGVVSVFVSFILGALIIYASRFLIKRRSKEFGLYLTLGMGKRQISLVLILETFFIGLLSLIVGLILGIVASQFTSVLVANMFDANLTNFQFVFSGAAFVKTIIYFAIIYIFVMIFNTINISRQKLINLLSNGQRNEKIKTKNLWICTIIFVVAAGILGYAYYLVTAGLEQLMFNSDGPDILLVPIIMGIVATFMLFWSLSGILLRLFMSFRKIYYYKLNSFVLRQFSSKINTTVVSMSLICLMLFVTICILGSALSINQSLHETIEKSLPVDIEVSTSGRYSHSIAEIYRNENINLDEHLKDIVTYKQYYVETQSTADYIGEPTSTIKHHENGETVTLYYVMEEFIYQSDYNRVAKLFDLPTVELADNEYAVIANNRQIVELRDKFLQAGNEITIFDQTFSPKYDHCILGTLRLEASGFNTGVIIVPDSFIVPPEEIAHQREFLLGNFIDIERSEEITRVVGSVAGRFFGDDETDENGYSQIYYYNVETKQDVIDNNVGTSALVTFVGLYLGIIFLISSAAVLALKELSESSDNRAKYTVLRKIGASNQMLNRALFWQIFIFFAFPLLIAVIHSVFGLMFCDFILSTLGGVDITKTLPAVSIILLAIYGGYFLITYFSSRNIIREKRN